MDSRAMQTPPLDPPVADTAPTNRALTGYDEQHVITYLRLLEAEKDGADWQEVAKLVLDRSRRELCWTFCAGSTARSK
jgi:hypothetical protein